MLYWLKNSPFYCAQKKGEHCICGRLSLKDVEAFWKTFWCVNFICWLIIESLSMLGMYLLAVKILKYELKLYFDMGIFLNNPFVFLLFFLSGYHHHPKALWQTSAITCGTEFPSTVLHFSYFRNKIEELTNYSKSPCN